MPTPSTPHLPPVLVLSLLMLMQGEVWQKDMSRMLLACPATHLGCHRGQAPAKLSRFTMKPCRPLAQGRAKGKANPWLRGWRMRVGWHCPLLLLRLALLLLLLPGPSVPPPLCPPPHHRLEATLRRIAAFPQPW